tara:strand:+ start:941 stop:1366 length:426 start_codon:yes stop_codon:yes gene_type:complete
MRRNLLYKLISIVSVFLYAATNYYQRAVQRKFSSFSPFKIVNTETEHLTHYALYHFTYLLLLVTMIYFWSQSIKKVKQTVIIHLVLLSTVFFSAIAFKRSFLLPLSGDLTNILLNGVLQKPIYPLLLLIYFIIENKQSKTD